MQILVVTSTYPTPNRPQQGAFNRVMVDALRQHHRVAVIAPIPWTQLTCRQVMRDLFSGHAGTDSCDRETFYPVSYYPPKILRPYYHHFYWLSIRQSLKRLASDFQPDVVLGYWLHPDGAAAVQAARQFGVPAVVMSGGTDLRILTQNPRRKKEIAQVIEDADRLVVLSRDLGRQAEILGAARSKTHLVIRGVDRDCFRPGKKADAREKCGVSESDVLLVWVGRLEAVKNPLMLLRAATEWKRRWGARFRLRVIGDGSMRASLLRFCEQSGLSGSVRLEGSLTQAELAVRYQAADATVLTSHSEGTPNVLLESIACGTRFVSTDVGGVREITTPGIDKLVSSDDIAELVDAVVETVEVGVTDLSRNFMPTDTAGMATQLEEVFERAIQSRVTTKDANVRAAFPSATGQVPHRRAS